MLAMSVLRKVVLIVHFYEATCCNKPEDSHLYIRRREDLKSYKWLIYSLFPFCLPFLLSPFLHSYHLLFLPLSFLSVYHIFMTATVHKPHTKDPQLKLSTFSLETETLRWGLHHRHRNSVTGEESGVFHRQESDKWAPLYLQELGTGLPATATQVPLIQNTQTYVWGLRFLRRQVPRGQSSGSVNSSEPSVSICQTARWCIPRDTLRCKHQWWLCTPSCIFTFLCNVSTSEKWNSELTSISVNRPVSWCFSHLLWGSVLHINLNIFIYSDV
jgi:hypothetical protein